MVVLACEMNEIDRWAPGWLAAFGGLRWAVVPAVPGCPGGEWAARSESVTKRRNQRPEQSWRILMPVQIEFCFSMFDVRCWPFAVSLRRGGEIDGRGERAAAAQEADELDLSRYLSQPQNT